jgi:hypothetical protein
MEGFRRERKSSKHPVFGSNFEPWYLRKIRRKATHELCFVIQGNDCLPSSEMRIDL